MNLQPGSYRAFAEATEGIRDEEIMSYGLPDGCTPADVDRAMDGEKTESLHYCGRCGHSEDEHESNRGKAYAPKRACSKCECDRFWQES